MFQFGVPPNRIDLLNDIDGVSFDSAWERRQPVRLEGPSTSIPISFLGLDDLIINKRASARPKDLEDLPYLLEAQKRRKDRGS